MTSLKLDTQDRSMPWRTALFAVFCSAALSACGGSDQVADSETQEQDSASIEFLDEPQAVRSPDGRTVVRVWSDNGLPYYDVSRDGLPVIQPSFMGFRFSSGPNLEDNLVLTSVERAERAESWEQPWGERRIVRDVHNELVASFDDASGEPLGFDMRVRVFDAGVGFRFEVERGSDPDAPIELTDELTRFVTDADSTAWWVPANEFNRYEYIYETSSLADAPNAHTPFTFRLPDNGPHVAIHEAALVNYSSMSIDQRRDGELEAELRPGYDGIKVHTTAHFNSPWRTIQIGDTASDLINGTDISLNLNEPNALGDVNWVEPGKYVGIWWGMHLNEWTWGSGENHGATNENVMRYIDFASENGFDGILVEGWNLGWDGDWFNNVEAFSFTESYPDYDFDMLTSYARENGVRIVGHHETSAGITNYEAQMADSFAMFQAAGITQVKSGYVDEAGEFMFRDEDGHARYTWHDSQFAVDHHLRVVQTAAEYGVSINAHEPVKDTGLRRTYPNWITREGARGQEFNAWGNPPNGPEHTVILPYTRMLSGPMDFTPGIFDLDFAREDGVRGVQTTLAKQLALYVVIYSPIQMAADLVENYDAHPDMFQFIRDVPTDWEESIALDGEIGEFTVIARQERGGDDWYLGAITDENARGLSVPLDFLEPGRTYTAQIYRDRADGHWQTNPYAYVVEEREVTSADVLEIALVPSGGTAIRFAAQ